MGESVKLPLRYYQNNIVGTLNLVELMAQHGCKNLVRHNTRSSQHDTNAFVACSMVYDSCVTLLCVELS